MSHESTEQGKLTVDFAIITIKEEEFEAVLDQFRAYDEHSKDSVVQGNRDYVILHVAARTGDATVAVTRCGTQGNGVSQDVTRDIIADVSPRWILLVGIAGGFPASEFSLGDVVLNTTVLDFSVEAVKQLKDASSSPERTFAVQEHRPHYQVENFATTVAGHRRALGNWFELSIDRGGSRGALEVPAIPLDGDKFYGSEDWKKDALKSLEQRLRRPANRPKVLGIALGSSDRLIKDTEIVQVWLKVARHLRAIEMESAGVHIATRGRSASRPSIPALSIRGISDIVGYKRDEAWTLYACHAAAAFAYAFVKSGYATQQAINLPRAKPTATDDVQPTEASDLNAEEIRGLDWGPAPEILEAIQRSLQTRAHAVTTVFARACKAANQASARAAAANLAMMQARRLLASQVPEDCEKIANPPLIIQADETAAKSAAGSSLGAVIWDSCDEYFGEMSERRCNGVGVYKIYQFGRRYSPDRVAHYRGEMWQGDYGSHGVWESAFSWVFTGEWLDKRPRLGWLTQSAEAEEEEYDLYVGSFAEPSELLWVPHGLGVSLKYETNELVFGTFHKGKATETCIRMPLAL